MQLFLSAKISIFNRKELLQKAKKKYRNGGKEKPAEYYQANKGVKKKAINQYKNLTEEVKEAKRKYSKNRYNKMKENNLKLKK